MTVWMIDAEGRAYSFTDTLTASFFVYGNRRELHAVCQYIASARLPVVMRRAERYDLFRREFLELLEIQVREPARFGACVRQIKNQFPALAYYNADISLAQFYFFARNIFPLARVEIEYDATRQIRAIELYDSAWDLDYALPPLNLMTLKLQDENETPDYAPNPNHDARLRPLQVCVNGDTRVLSADEPRAMLLQLRAMLLQYDPDVLVTAWGDSFILPRLLDLAQQYGVALPLNRDAAHAVEFRAARSYFSYGRIVHKTASHLLAGRWHIDCRNAFLIDDYSLDGVFELARVSQLPVQRVARVSTGTCVSAMEIATAYREQILIPMVKREAEEMKSAAQFVTADKGGLVFQPIVGLHENVAELDFTSMFPTIMDKFNISAETLNCECCPHSVVPELGYHICQKRRGLIPQTIAPLVAKRAAYKKRARATNDAALKEKYKRRVSCLKWALVTVFGYTGYKNARFGKIEAHEAINAYGRDALLQAKELAEARGFRMLHAIVDALYLQKQNARDEDYLELVNAISETTRLPIELEGVYHWLAFLPSRQDARLPVANRYFGVFRDGEIKARGIELRRSDTPPFIRAAQKEMLALLAQAKNRAEFRARMDDVMQLTRARMDALYAQKIPRAQLALTSRLSRDPRAYRSNHPNALVARQLLARGVELAPGERIQYLVLDHRARVPTDRVRALEYLDANVTYDAERYAELLLRSVAALFSCVGVSQKMLRAQFNHARAFADPQLVQLAAPMAELPLWAWARQNAAASAHMASFSARMKLEKTLGLDKV